VEFLLFDLINYQATNCQDGQSAQQGTSLLAPLRVART